MRLNTSLSIISKGVSILHCLNLKLTYACTNQCSFCFSSYLKDEVISREGLFRAVESGYQRGCRELVLSGGEPTVCADVLCDVMDFAKKTGYEKYIVQTNGSGFADKQELVSYFRDFSDKADVSVSFSVHGHTERIHDEMSRTPGAFNKLMTALRLIAEETSCSIFTNTVISSLNISHLRQIAMLLQPFHPEIIQFSMMHLKEASTISTGLLDAAKAVRALKGTVDESVLKTEGIPYCLLYGMEQCVGESYWPNALDLYNKDKDYMADFDQLRDGMRWKRSDCCQCVMNEICAGIWKEHAQEFSMSDIRPIR